MACIIEQLLSVGLKGLATGPSPLLPRLLQCLPTPERILQYSQRQVSQYGAPLHTIHRRLLVCTTHLEENLRRVSLVDHENLHRLMNYQDPCAALIKLSDRLHNMRTIGSVPAAKQARIS